MKTTILIALSFVFLGINDQSHTEEIQAFQQELNDSYKDKEKTPLSKKNRRKFKKHPFFPINADYKVKATFERAKGIEVIEFPTSTDRMATYVKYGVATFSLDGEDLSLNIYQSPDVSKMEGYEDYLFLPFKDATNGKESYGGGRYMDLRLGDIEGETITLDFNKAYAPYCAYSGNFSCPVPPRDNHLMVPIKAGVMHLEMPH